MNRLVAALDLVRVPSVSRGEGDLASQIESVLRANSHLDVERIGDNVVARTTGYHATRLLVAGHLDTIPGDASLSVISGDQLRGVGACDMKGSLSVMLELAIDPEPRSVELTWVFYAREEIARSESGLGEIAELRPDLLAADAVVLAEPTGGVVEAGCQGSMRVRVTLGGARAHTARPFTGVNAIHRLGSLLARVASYEPRVAYVDNVAYCEQLQAVKVEGGVAGNVVPDSATCTLNHRFAPDRTHQEAMTWLRDFLADELHDGDALELSDWAPSASPAMTNERLRSLVAATGQPARGKVGWTDVATFSELGIPATNFGAGDPLLAHRSDEFVTVQELDEFARVLGEWVR